jgi:hypothetical protein
MRVSKQVFDTILVPLKQVRAEDPEYNLPVEIALDLNELSYKICQGTDLARIFIQNNIFIDPSTKNTYRLSPNPQMGNKYVGEHLHSFMIAEYKLPFLLVNVKISIALIKYPNIPAKREGIVVKEIDLQSISSQQTVILPFDAVFEDCNYEFFKKDPDEDTILRVQGRGLLGHDEIRAPNPCDSRECDISIAELLFK